MERETNKQRRRVRHIYRIDHDQPARIRKRHDWDYLTRKLSRLFYLTLSYSQFRRLAGVATKKEGSWESSFIMLIENRVIGMLYRMQVNMNIFELRWFVSLGNVLVNNKRISYYNAAVNYYDIMRFNNRISLFLRMQVVERFKAGAFYFGIPRYMFVSYKYMFAFVFQEPKRKDLVFPIKAVDVYRSGDYH